MTSLSLSRSASWNRGIAVVVQRSWNPSLNRNGSLNQTAVVVQRSWNPSLNRNGSLNQTAVAVVQSWSPIAAVVAAQMSCWSVVVVVQTTS